MQQIRGYLELSSLNAETASAYLQDAENELAIVIERLEQSLGILNKLRHECTTGECNLDES